MKNFDKKKNVHFRIRVKVIYLVYFAFGVTINDVTTLSPWEATKRDPSVIPRRYLMVFRRTVFKKEVIFGKIQEHCLLFLNIL